MVQKLDNWIGWDGPILILHSYVLIDLESRFLKKKAVWVMGTSALHHMAMTIFIRHIYI